MFRYDGILEESTRYSLGMQDTFDVETVQREARELHRLLRPSRISFAIPRDDLHANRRLEQFPQIAEISQGGPHRVRSEQLV